MIVGCIFYEFLPKEACEAVAPIPYLPPPYTFESFGGEFFAKLCALASIHGVNTPSPIPFARIEQAPFAGASFYHRINDGRQGIVAAIFKAPLDNLTPKVTPFYLPMRRAVRYCLALDAPARPAFLKSLTETVLPSYIAVIDLLHAYEYEGVQGLVFLAGKNDHFEHEVFALGKLALREGSYQELFHKAVKEASDSVEFDGQRIFKLWSQSEMTGEQFVFLLFPAGAPNVVLDAFRSGMPLFTTPKLHAGLLEKIAMILLGNLFEVTPAMDTVQPIYGETALLKGNDLDTIFKIHTTPSQYLPKLIEEFDQMRMILTPKG